VHSHQSTEYNIDNYAQCYISTYGVFFHVWLFGPVATLTNPCSTFLGRLTPFRLSSWPGECCSSPSGEHWELKNCIW